jgi:hypothetical protein
MGDESIHHTTMTAGLSALDALRRADRSRPRRRDFVFTHPRFGT